MVDTGSEQEENEYILKLQKLRCFKLFVGMFESRFMEWNFSYKECNYADVITPFCSSCYHLLLV